MHNNYYFLRQLSRQLHQELIGFRIGDVFSQAKNELVISLYKEREERFIKANLDPTFCCLSVPELFNRARRNSVDLFYQIIDLEIIDIVQIENDRSFYFQLDNGFQLLFKMHGNRSNVILFQEEKILNVFKNKLKQDKLIKIVDLSKQLISDRKAFEKANGNYNSLIPTFGKSFDKYFQGKQYDLLDLDKKYTCLNTLLEYLDAPTFYIHFDEDDLPSFNLYETK